MVIVVVAPAVNDMGVEATFGVPGKVFTVKVAVGSKTFATTLIVLVLFGTLVV